MLWRLIEFTDLATFGWRKTCSPSTNSFCGTVLPVWIEGELLCGNIIGSDRDGGSLSETEGFIGVDDSGFVNKEGNSFDVDMLIFCHLLCAHVNVLKIESSNFQGLLQN